MAIMHGTAATVLYPPIDDSSSKSGNNGGLVDHDGRGEKDEFITGNPSDRSVEKRSSNAMSTKLSANFDALKRAKLEHESIHETHRDLAVETARLANDEIARMERAVAELEALVMEKARGDAVVGPNGAALQAEPQFPTLPEVVMVPRYDDHDSYLDEGHEHLHCDGEAGGGFDEENSDGKLSPAVVFLAASHDKGSF